ncbi:MAG: hypothetical protein R3F62_18755 [Planctomycetota bacterium]
MAVAILLALAAYAPALRPSRQLSGRDLLTLFYPLHQRVAAGYRGQESLTRDPSRGAGAPLVPNPLAQVVYPPALVRGVFPFDLGFGLFLLGHVALAGIGAACLSRRLGAGELGVSLAAAGATLAGPVLAGCRTPNLLAAAAWTGIAACGFFDLARPGGRRRRGLLEACAAVALGILAGGAGVVGLWGLLVAVAVPVWAGWRRAPGAYLRIGAATGLGALLAGPHLIPFLRWLPQTARGAEAFSLAEAASWSTPWERWGEFVVPGLSFSTAPELYSSAARSGFAYGGPLNASLHLGLPVVALGLVAAWRVKAARALALGLGVWLLLATPIPGANGAARTPLLVLLRELPGLGGWRYPAKAFLPLAVVLPALAGVGLGRVPARVRRPLCVATVGLLILAPWIDGNVLPTVPRRWYHEPPPVGRGLPTGPTAPRYLRLTNPPPGALTVRQIRAGHRAILRENLPGLYGIPALLDYDPGRNARVDRFLASIRRPPPELLDAEALARDACVGAVLTPQGLARLPAAPRLQLSPGEVEVERYTATEVVARLKVPGGRPATLFLSEGFEPGWSATLEVEGEVRALELRPASELFIAASVPPGPSTVRFSYGTPGFAWGWIACLCGALGLGGAWWCAGRAPRSA